MINLNIRSSRRRLGMAGKGAAARCMALAARAIHGLRRLWKNPSIIAASSGSSTPSIRSSTSTTHWLAFARENAAPQLTAALVLDQSIWRFIQGQETIYLYKQIFARLRAGKSPVKFPFRCDSPDCRRFMEMQLSLLPGDAIQFMAQILREEWRQPRRPLGCLPG